MHPLSVPVRHCSCPEPGAHQGLDRWDPSRFNFSSVADVCTNSSHWMHACARPAPAPVPSRPVQIPGQTDLSGNPSSTQVIAQMLEVTETGLSAFEKSHGIGIILGEPLACMSGPWPWHGRGIDMGCPAG